MAYSIQNLKVSTAAGDTTSSAVAPPCKNLTKEVLNYFSLNKRTVLIFKKKPIFSRKVSPHTIRHAEITFLAARLRRPPAAPANSPGAGAVSRKAASEPTACHRVSAAAETHVERALGHSRGQARARPECNRHSPRPATEPRSRHQEAAPAQRVSSPPRAASLRAADERPAAAVDDVSCPFSG